MEVSNVLITRGITMQIVKPVQLPQAAEAMAAAYRQVPIPFAILDSALQMVWQNEAMRTSCPAFCLARGLFLLTGEIPAAGIIKDVSAMERDRAQQVTSSRSLYILKELEHVRIL